jgi:hypothetical protein
VYVLDFYERKDKWKCERWESLKNRVVVVVHCAVCDRLHSEILAEGALRP